MLLPKDGLKFICPYVYDALDCMKGSVIFVTSRAINGEEACSNFRDADFLATSVDACAFHAKQQGAYGFCVSGTSCFFSHIEMDAALADAESADSCDAEAGTGAHICPSPFVRARENVAAKQEIRRGFCSSFVCLVLWICACV
jgi:hypothetical protein